MKFNPEVIFFNDDGMVLFEFCDGTEKAVHVHEALTIKRRLLEIFNNPDDENVETKKRDVVKKIDDWSKEITQAHSIRYHLIQELKELELQKEENKIKWGESISERTAQALRDLGWKDPNEIEQLKARITELESKGKL